MKHTSGPWFVNGPWNIQADTHTEIPVITAHITPLRNGSLHEREANARLIAAAPELLSALTDIERKLTRSGFGLRVDGLHDDADGTLKILRAAIAKATGETS